MSNQEESRDQESKANDRLPDRTSGGEACGAEAYRKLRGLLMHEEDVHAVHGLSWIPQESRWIYLRQTPFATWPRYVVGYTDATNEHPTILFRCQHYETALSTFDEHNYGDHQ